MATKKSINEHIQWLKTQNIENDVNELEDPMPAGIRNSAAIYIHGRDIKFRPIIIINFA